MNVLCLVCDKLFSNQSSLNRHRREVHGLESFNVEYEQNLHNYKCLEQDCNSSFICSAQLRVHLKTKHNIDNEEIQIDYLCYGDFKKWLANEEKENGVQYFKGTGAKESTLLSIKRYYFYCFRTGSLPKSLENPKRFPKIQGSCKNNLYCTSTIIVNEDSNTGKCSIKYHKIHYGHGKEIKYLKVSQQDKEVIASKLMLGISASRRELEDVNEILHFAKLTEHDILPASQALFFAEKNNYESNFRMLELNNDLLNAIQANQNIYIKGEEDDEVVICTGTSTLHVLEAETSNSLLLVKPFKSYSIIEANTERIVQKIQVLDIFQEYLEVNIGKPHLRRLNDLLNSALYRGKEHEYELENVKLFTLNELKNMVQASDQELLDSLKYMDVVEIDGKIRLLDFEYHFRTLSYMLKLIEENSWDLDSIDYDETCDVLKDLVPIEVLRSLFEKYTEESKIIDGLQLYRYKESEVCSFFARVLLREAGKFNLEEFLQAWKDSVPEGMIPNEEMLHGIAIINRKSSPNVIWAFEENTLPDNINDRFKVLFEAKDKWTVPEISPYIRRLATKQLDVNALLAKHARTSKVDGVKHYSAKHAK